MWVSVCVVLLSLNSARVVLAQDDPILIEDRVIVFEFQNLDFGPQSWLPGFSTPWLYDEGTEPFFESRTDLGWYAMGNIRMNPSGTGDGSCQSGGSGVATQTQVLQREINLPDDLDSPLSDYTVSITDLTLDPLSFEHVNVIDDSRPWNTANEGGDRNRFYEEAVFEILDKGEVVFRAVGVNYTQNLSYPQPAGPGENGQFALSAFLLGMIDLDQTNEIWREQIDPEGNGVFFAALTGTQLGGNTCFTASSLRFAVRPLTGLLPPISGALPSTPGQIATAGRMADAAVAMGGIVGFSALAGSLASIGVLAATGLTSAAAVSVNVPGTGVSKMLRTAQYGAMFGQIKNAGFSEQMLAFTDGLDPYMMRWDAPFSSSSGARRMAVRRHQFLSRSTARQDGDIDDDTFVDEPTTTNTALWSFVALLLCVVMHGIVWLFTRKAAAETQLSIHAFFAYISMCVIAWVYVGAVLVAIQYLASHPNGSGTAGGYAAASMMIIFIGIALLALVIFIGVRAYKDYSQGRLEWVPKKEASDPSIRDSKIVAGSYYTDPENKFHAILACWYEGYTGPRLWMLFGEWVLLILMTIVTGAVAVSTVVVIVVAVLAAIFTIMLLLLHPFVDKIEQILVSLVAALEMGVAFCAIGSEFANGETVNDLNEALIIIQLIAMICTFVLAFYTDLITIFVALWKLIKEYRNRGNTSEYNAVDPEAEFMVPNDAGEQLQKSLDNVDLAIQQGLFMSEDRVEDSALDPAALPGYAGKSDARNFDSAEVSPVTTDQF
eukprot:CAMPEP_0185845506 /NCGR_PEP_ID=MMETSP1354-20130828/1460_1 /TAXON_ID=708628 /ORGANISM="Erythrolobus madagascarensis, Strain CCMP3276" /LENGTH=774 /DNA_ID=CAMNT_0028545487 /DNA_START=330 /DNA_END=2654 /DNA_ORIENTATION=-